MSFSPTHTEDFFLDIKKLSMRSDICERTLKEHIKDPINPLPCFRVKGKILVHWGEFKAWLEGFREKTEDLTEKIDALVGKMAGSA